MRRLLHVPAALLTVLFLGWGCYVLVDALAIEHRSSSVELDAVPVVVLDVDGGGRVRVVGGSGDRIRVDFDWREGLQAATVEASIDGDGRLRVRTACPKVLNAFCTVRATVHVPADTAVEGRGSNAIEVADLAGPIDLSVHDGGLRVEGGEGAVTALTRNGSVTVADRTGPLHLSTRNGSIRAERVDAPAVEADSHNGRIDLDLLTAPDGITAATRNGSIAITLPDDAPPYATRFSTRNGTVEDPVRTDPGAERTLDAHTRNGSISVRYRTG